MEPRTTATARPAHRALIDELVSLVPAEERNLCRTITDVLLGLGYIPQKQRVRGYVLSFKHHQVGQTIAKIGAPDRTGGGARYSIKFYACKQPPSKFVRAVQGAIETSSLQYRCCGCGVCGATAEDRGYRHLLPSGEEFVRCGAYVVRVPDLGAEDADDFANLLREQHQYFLSRTT